MINHFEENIRETLKGHQVDVPNRVWKKIDERKRKSSVLLLLLKTTVAIFILGSLTYLFIPNQRINTITIDTIPLSCLQLENNLTSNKKLTQTYYELYPNQVEPLKQIKTNSIAPISVSPKSIYENENNVIVLTIDPTLTIFNKPKTSKSSKNKSRVNSEQLLSELESQIKFEHQTNLEKYISKLDKITKSHKINKTINTANAWVKKKINHK